MDPEIVIAQQCAGRQGSTRVPGRQPIPAAVFAADLDGGGRRDVSCAHAAERVKPARKELIERRQVVCPRRAAFRRSAIDCACRCVTVSCRETNQGTDFHAHRACGHIARRNRFYLRRSRRQGAGGRRRLHGADPRRPRPTRRRSTPNATAISPRSSRRIGGTRKRDRPGQQSAPPWCATTRSVPCSAAAHGEFALYQQVMADDARRDAGGDCRVRLAGLRKQDRPLAPDLRPAEG